MNGKNTPYICHNLIDNKDITGRTANKGKGMGRQVLWKIMFTGCKTAFEKFENILQQLQ